MAEQPAPEEPECLTIPETLHPAHADILREHLFEDAGLLGDALLTDEFDGARVVYAITNPGQTEIVYIGDSEQGQNLRDRLRSHVRDRQKMGHVEKESRVYVHVMITEYMVLDCFQQDIGRLPVCNKRKVAKHV